MPKKIPIGERCATGSAFVRLDEEEQQAIDRIRQEVFDSTGYTITISDVIRKAIRDQLVNRKK